MKLEIKPSFVIAALDQERPVRKGIKKALDVAAQLSMGELLAHNGVRLEKLKDLTDAEGNSLYSMKATTAARIIARVDGDTLVLLYLESDHDKAYKRR